MKPCLYIANIGEPQISNPLLKKLQTELLLADIEIVSEGQILNEMQMDELERESLQTFKWR